MASTSKSEQSYIRSSLLANPPLRPDGRSLSDYRPISLETKVSPLANGSARVNIGGLSLIGVGGSLVGTEVLAAVKAEVETLADGGENSWGSMYGGNAEGSGRIACNVTSSPSAYPNLNNLQLEDHQQHLTTILSEVLSHPCHLPKNLSILPGKKAWLLHLDLLVLSDNGNIYDALFLAAAAALRDTRVPRTRLVDYKAQTRTQNAGSTIGDNRMMLGDEGGQEQENHPSGFDTRAIKKASDFELVDYWDEGEPLECDHTWPLGVTMNLVPPVYFIDASPAEENAISSRILIMYSFPYKGSGPKTGEVMEIEEKAKVNGMRMFGALEMTAPKILSIIRDGEKHARELQSALDTYLCGKTNT